MSSLFLRRSRGLFASVAVLGLVAACMQHPASAPPPSSPAPPPPAAASAPPPVPMVMVAKRANFRDGPSIKAPIIGKIPAGTPVVLIGGPKDKWVQVSYQNRVGYVFGKLIKH